MSLSRIIIRNFKSIKYCDISFAGLNVLIGENGTGKTNLLEAISYFFSNLTGDCVRQNVFDENNPFSNEVRITLVYDLTELVRISKANNNDITIVDNSVTAVNGKYGDYYNKIVSTAATAKDNKIYVELTQIKGKGARWNYCYEERAVFKSLFPVFFINTRNLDVNEWERVWDILGELSKVSNQERENLEKDIKKILTEENSETQGKIKSIIDIFSNADISIKPATPKEFAKYLAKLYLSGEKIQQGGKRLAYYSAGTNSVKYIELLLKAINAIALKKLKAPVVLFDEPEIGLHTHYLDELSDIMSTNEHKLCLIMATHSSRLAKNMIVKYPTVTLFSVKLLDNNTSIRKMRKFSQYSPESKYRVADDHINAYFSRAILFVEGETELELFANPYLHLLFPALKEIDIFKAISQKPELKIMNPSLNKIVTPYLCLVDLDKVITYNREQRIFNKKNEFFDSSGKEKFYYRNKKQSETYLHHQRRHIEAMIKALRVHYFLPYYSCQDSRYADLVKAIHEYLLSYHVFTLETTIEGALINKHNILFALDFLQRKKPTAFVAFKTYWDTLLATDRLNSLRMVFNGKSDLLLKHSDLRLYVKNMIASTMIGSKTSGWVSDYIDSYFQKKLEEFQPGVKLTVSSFQNFLADNEKRKDILKRFRYDFAEMDELLERVCGMINI